MNAFTPPTPAELEHFFSSQGWTKTFAAAAAGITYRTLARYCSGEQECPKSVWYCWQYFAQQGDTK